MRNVGGQGDHAGGLAPERLSELIGAIYDCAIDPARWPETLAMIGSATRCCAGMIMASNFDPPTVRLLEVWNFEQEVVSRLPEYGTESAGVWLSMPDFWTRDLDLPGSSMREAREAYSKTRWVREVMVPRGMVDSMHLMLIRQENRVADIGLYRHGSEGMISDGDLKILHLLAPHVRRAITVSDLIDMKNLENAALVSALDGIAAGAVIVGDAGRVLHANEAARTMFEARAPILKRNGRISTHHPDVANELLRAIELARKDEVGIERKGIGVPLVHGDSAVATAHVLPLARGTRTRLVAEATAAVFVVPSGEPMPADVDTIGRIFGLTPAEVRLLRCLAAGDSLPDAAAEIGSSLATMKTHRSRIFAKMGVTRHAELMALVRRLVPPSFQG